MNPNDSTAGKWLLWWSGHGRPLVQLPCLKRCPPLPWQATTTGVACAATPRPAAYPPAAPPRAAWRPTTPIFPSCERGVGGPRFLVSPAVPAGCPASACLLPTPYRRCPSAASEGTLFQQGGQHSSTLPAPSAARGRTTTPTCWATAWWRFLPWTLTATSHRAQPTRQPRLNGLQERWPRASEPSRGGWQSMPMQTASDCAGRVAVQPPQNPLTIDLPPGRGPRLPPDSPPLLPGAAPPGNWLSCTTRHTRRAASTAPSLACSGCVAQGMPRRGLAQFRKAYGLQRGQQLSKAATPAVQDLKPPPPLPPPPPAGV